jgi:probable O-glycosylation ligase (exosortase A-associated)
MITEALFFISYLVLLPIAFMFPFAGALAYEWLQYMPPYDIYHASGLGNFSLIMGGIGLIGWMIKDKKEIPAPKGLLFAFIAYALWVNVTQLATIVPNDGGAGLWDRAWKMLIFTLALSMMARTRQRIEAFIWVVCFAIGNFIVIGAIKTVLSGGGGETVVGANGNILGERVSFAIAITSLIPLIRYLRDHATLIARTRRVLMALDGLTICCILATVGSQARTGVVCLAVLGLFYFIKSKRKMTFLLIVPVLIGLVSFVAPAGYFDRVNSIENHDDGSSLGRIDSWIWGWNFALEHPITGGGFHTYLLHQTGTIDHPMYLEAHNIFFETMADHGFVGLGLLLLVLLGTIVNCQALSKRARKLPELDWAVSLGTMLQLAMWTFIAGSQLLHTATQSTPYELCALSMAARGIVERRLASEPKSVINRGVPGMNLQRPAAAGVTAGAPVPAAAFASQI